MMLFKTMAIS